MPGLLNFILNLRRPQQRQQMGILSEILSQAMGPKMGGMEQVAPSIGIPEGASYEPGIFYPGPGGMKIERPTTLPPNILSTILSDPRFSQGAESPKPSQEVEGRGNLENESNWLQRSQDEFFELEKEKMKELEQQTLIRSRRKRMAKKARIAQGG